MRHAAKTGDIVPLGFLRHFFAAGLSARRPERRYWVAAALAVALGVLGNGLAPSFFVPSARAASSPDVNVEATVDRNEMEPGDTVFFSIVATLSEDAKVAIPSSGELKGGAFAAFDVVKDWDESGARTQMSTDPATGRPRLETTRTRAHHYVLQPKAAGTVAIGSVSVRVGDQEFATKPISIRVAPGASQGPRGRRAQPPGRRGQAPPPPQGLPGGEEDEEEDLFSLLLRRQGLPIPRGFGGLPQPGGNGGFRAQPLNPSEAFFVQVEVDKAEAYVGEQVTATWYLYTRGQIRDLDTLKYPSLRGFWKEDIEIATHLNFANEVVNGIPYKKALLASFALFPIKEGTAVIDPYTAKCSVIAFDDPFGALSGKTYAATKSSSEVKILVKPIPAEGRPADFSGAVGDFQVSARVEDPKVIANQPFSLKIRFEGRGNAKLIEMPAFAPPDGMEIYDTQKEAKFERNGASYKDFSILLIPRRTGNFTLPPVAVSIFDPAQRRFVQRKSDPIVVVALAGSAGAAAPSLPLALDGGKGAEATVRSVAPVADPEFRASPPDSGVAQGVALAAALLAALAALMARARARLGWGRRREPLQARIKARFRKLDGLCRQGNWRGVGRDGTNAVYWALGEASGQGGAGVELEKLLLRAPPSVRRELGDEASKALEKLQALAFAPEEAVGSLRESAALAELLSSTEALLLRAASLAESAERSSESESGPATS
jgi:hypothetical protein